MEIRPYRSFDREAVRRIALATAMMGRPSSLFFKGEDLFADALTQYFTDYEPESSFVAVADQGTVGYIIGARDTRVMEARSREKLLLPLIGKAWMSGTLLCKKNLRLLSQVILPAFCGRLAVPDFYEGYPATLHINLLSGVRGVGLGGKLIEAFLNYLRRMNVGGVHMATMSEAAGRFFVRQGFSLLYRSSRPYFHHVIGEDVPLLIYGKRLV